LNVKYDFINREVFELLKNFFKSDEINQKLGDYIMSNLPPPPPPRAGKPYGHKNERENSSKDILAIFSHKIFFYLPILGLLFFATLAFKSDVLTSGWDDNTYSLFEKAIRSGELGLLTKVIGIFFIIPLAFSIMAIYLKNNNLKFILFLIIGILQISFCILGFMAGNSGLFAKVNYYWFLPGIGGLFIILGSLHYKYLKNNK